MEFVWVVPRTALFPQAAVHGLCPLTNAKFEERFLQPAREKGFFMERRYAEAHPNYKQPIPYVAIIKNDSVLCLTRLDKQGEARLHGKKSIGVGGHINPCDAPATQEEDLFLKACHRELYEELVLPQVDVLPLTPIGLLNDDTTEVGAVHVGVVYALDANQIDVSIREKEAMAGEFRTLASLSQATDNNHENFETWSELLIRSEALNPLTNHHPLTP